MELKKSNLGYYKINITNKAILNNIEIKFIPIYDDEDLIKYIGIAKFNTNKPIEYTDIFDLDIFTTNCNENTYIKHCDNLTKINDTDNRYRVIFDVINVEIETAVIDS